MKRVIGYSIFAVACILAVCFLISRTRMENIDLLGRKKEAPESGVKGEVEAAENKEWSVPSVYAEKVNDILDFEAEVIVSDDFREGIFYRTQGHYQEYDADAFLNLFFGDKEIGKKDTFEMPDRNEKSAEGYTYWSDDGCSLCIYPTNAIYSKVTERNYYFYGFCDIVGNLTMYNADEYSKTKELTFMTRAEIEQKVQENLEHIGFHPGDVVYQAYALDASTLCEETERVYEWGFSEGK